MEAIKHYIGPYIERDVYCTDDRGYLNLSLYLDNPQCSLYWSSSLGEKNRFKLRFRSYTSDTDGFVILEIKRRINQVILKERAKMHREVIPLIFSGAPISDSLFIRDSPGDRVAFHNFRSLVERIQAGPKIFVRYNREAYSGSNGQDVRLTIDHNLATRECDFYSHELWRDNHDWHAVEAPIVFEIKFNGAFPQWVQTLIRHFNLRQESYSKYVSCLQNLHNRGAMNSLLKCRGEDPLWASKELLWDIAN